MICSRQQCIVNFVVFLNYWYRVQISWYHHCGLLTAFKKRIVRRFFGPLHEDLQFRSVHNWKWTSTSRRFGVKNINWSSEKGNLNSVLSSNFVWKIKYALSCDKICSLFVDSKTLEWMTKWIAMRNSSKTRNES